MKTTFSLVVVALACASAAQATTYNYVGNPMNYNTGGYSDGAHLEIAAELNCTAPCAQGTYVWHPDLDQGIQSVMFSVFNADNTLRYKVSSRDPGFAWFSNRIDLSETGAVQRWYLTGMHREPWGGTWEAKSTGFLDPYWGEFQYGTVQIGDAVQPSINESLMITNYDNPGTWSVEAPTPVPLPAALPLFAAGLGVLGLIAGRRKRRVATAQTV